MSDNEDTDRANNSESLPQSRENLPTPKTPQSAPAYQFGYTASWREICREIVKAYIEIYPSNNFGKVLKPPTLTKMIMEDFKYTPYYKSLTVRDIYGWLAETTKLRDPKFYYIDRFVRKFRFSDPAMVKARDEVTAYLDTDNRKVLRRIYSSPTKIDNDDFSMVLNNLDGSLFLSKLFKIKNRKAGVIGLDELIDISQILLHFHSASESMLGVTALYSASPFSRYQALDRDVSDRDFAHYVGYLVPQAYNSYWMQGVILLQRPEYKGSGRHDISTLSRFHFDINK